MSKDDPVAMLAEIQHHHRQHVSQNFPEPGICVSRCADRWPCQAYRSAAAAKAALAHHVEAVKYHIEPESTFRYCSTCSGHPACPCPEVRAITSALAGKEAE